MIFSHLPAIQDLKSLGTYRKRIELNIANSILRGLEEDLIKKNACK